MITIAYCLHKPTIGGAELHLLDVLKRLDRKRFRPLMVFLGDGREGAMYADFKALDLEIFNLNMPRGTFRYQNLQKLYELVRWLRARQVDIVHGYLLEGNLIGVLAGRFAGVPVLISSKRSWEQHSPMQLAASKVTNRLSTKVTAVSRAVGEFTVTTESCAKEKIVVIPNGIRVDAPPVPAQEVEALKRGWGIPPGALVVGTVARLSWKKGYRYFVEAAAQVHETCPDVYFVAMGDGPLMEEMRTLARDCGVVSNIVFAGWQSDPRSKLPVLDIYLCSSVIEGMSNALLDAMMQRLPVIATAVGGNLENVVDGETGYLVPPADPAAIADKILALVDDPELARRMGAAGERRVRQEYTIERVVAQMEALYEASVAEKGLSSKHSYEAPS